MDFISVGLLAFFLSSSEPTEPIPQLQGMKTTLHLVDKEQIWSLCKDTIPKWKLALGYLPVACAWIYPEKMECHAYVAKGESVDLLGLPQKPVPNQEAVEHELKHCQGYDHNGDLARQLQAIKQAKQTVPAGEPATTLQ